MLERTTQTQTDAVIERQLTLVERIQPILDDLMMGCFKHGFHQKEMTEAEFIDYSRKNCVPLKREIIGILKQHSQETCNWRNNKGTGLWECHYGGDYTSDCGLEWNMSNKDSPSENEMHFCPKCGKKLVEVQPPSEVQDDGKI